MIRLRNPLAGWGFLAPSLIGVAGFLLLPVAVAFVVSLTSWDLIGQGRFVGLDNYRQIFSGSPASGNIVGSLLVTVIFTVLSVPLSMALGIVLALALGRALPGSGVFRTILVIPWVCAPIALGVVWKWIFQPSDGALNAVLGHRVEWLSDPNLALPAVAVVAIWQNVGYISLFFQAGLTKIPASLYEAARLDGAGPFRLLWSITLPLLRPTTFFIAVTSVISSFQVFDTVYALTGGGPQHRTEVIASLIYNEAFSNFRVGRACAIAVVLFVLLVAITLLQQRFFSRRITYDMS